jgi:hypothetical protein
MSHAIGKKLFLLLPWACAHAARCQCESPWCVPWCGHAPFECVYILRAILCLALLRFIAFHFFIALLFLLLFPEEFLRGDHIIFHSKFHFASYRIASFSRLRTNQL